MGRHLKVTDRRMATAVKLVLAEPLIAGAPSLMRDMMGNRMLNHGSFAQRGASALGFDLGAELVLERFVLTDMQASPVTDLGCGALRSLWTPITGTGGKLGVFARDHRYGLAPRTGDWPVRKVQSEVVLAEESPALRPGAGNDVDALLGPLRNAWTGHVPQVDIQLQQPWRLLQRLDQQFHRFMLWLVRRADHDLARYMTCLLYTSDAADE